MGSGCSKSSSQSVSEPLPSRHVQEQQYLRDDRKTHTAGTQAVPQERKMSASSMQRLSAASIGSPAIARPVYVSPSPEMPSSPKTAMTEQQAPLSEPVPTPSSLGDVLTTEQSNTLRVMAACTCDVNNRVQEFAVRKVSCPAQLQELSQANSVLWEACLSAIKH
eukprot:209502-Rhodomonas_salina.1